MTKGISRGGNKDFQLVPRQLSRDLLGAVGRAQQNGDDPLLRLWRQGQDLRIVVGNFFRGRRLRRPARLEHGADLLAECAKSIGF